MKIQAAHNTLIVVRTHTFNPDIARFADFVGQSGYDLCFAIDERAGQQWVKGYPKLGLDQSVYEGLGLPLIKDMFWRCGDYALYAARKKLAAYEYYWLVEPDVFFGFAWGAPFFRLFEEDESDLLAAHLWHADSSWVWHAAMAANHEKVYGCLFPCVRMSARAINFLMGKRKAASYGTSAPFDFPNDESFCATELMNNGFAGRDLNSFARPVYTMASFGLSHPYSATWLSARGFDNTIYHPALTGAPFVTKLRARLADDVRTERSREFIAEKYQGQLMEQYKLESHGDVGGLFVKELTEALAAARSEAGPEA